MAKVVKFKFSLGDTVHFINKNKAATGVVKRLKYDECEHGFNVLYCIDTGLPSYRTIYQEECFSSKAKLLKSL